MRNNYFAECAIEPMLARLATMINLISSSQFAVSFALTGVGWLIFAPELLSLDWDFDIQILRKHP
jgi:hypothetical protein